MASKACCTIPPVVSDTDNYSPKGSHRELSGYRTYVTGSESSTTGVFVVYDIFGLDFPQTIQGSDIIASSGHLVVIPDLFKGEPMDIDAFPPDTDEKKARLGAFFQNAAAPPKNITAIKELLPTIKSTFPSVQRWAIIGYCWGGKIATLLASEDLFVAAAQLHPALMDSKDAENLKIPHLTIATKDENKQISDEFKARLKDPKSAFHYWDGTFHGFMAARANLADKDNLEYYQKGYQTLVDWLKSVL